MFDRRIGFGNAENEEISFASCGRLIAPRHDNNALIAFETLWKRDSMEKIQVSIVDWIETPN